MASKIIYIFVALFFCAGFFVRIYNLGTTPYAFHDDELDAGYIGRYILLHGKDIRGNSWPLYYDKLGDFRPSGIFYFSGLSTFLFGINEFAVRFPSALFGFLTAISLYVFVHELFKNKYIAVFSSFLLLFSPWHIVISRATSEASIGMFFIITGLALLIKYFHTQRSIYIITSFLSLFISYFFYHSFRLVVPLLLLPFFFYGIKKTQKITLAALTFFFFLISTIIAMTPWGGGRFQQVAFFKNPSIANTIDSMIFSDGPGNSSNLMRARMFHNKAVIYTREFAKQYIQYFSPDFLFIQGGFPLRYAVPESGLQYFVTIPFLFTGLIFLFKYQRPFNRYYLLYLLSIAPLASALTFEDSPNVHRSILLVIPIQILAAVGIVYLFKDMRKYKILVQSLAIGLTSIFLIECIYFYHQYVVHSPSYKSVLRKDGNRELAKSLLQHKDTYDEILVASAYEIGFYYRFYDKRFDSLPEGSVGFNNTLTGIDNITFTTDECPSKKFLPSRYTGKRILIVDQGDCPANSEQFSLVEEILRQDQTHAYNLLVPNTLQSN